MKRPLDIDLTDQRAATLTLIDEWMGQQMAIRHPLAAMYVAKARLAQAILASPSYDARLAVEAAQRGMTQVALCRLILQRQAEDDIAMLALEEYRMRAKAEVQQAQTQDALSGIAARFL